MVKLFATCRFCDERVYFEVPPYADASQVTYCFKAAMDAHLLVHVEEITEIPNARH